MGLPETNQINISHLMTLGGGLIAIILALVAVIYHGIQERLVGHQEQLDAGSKAFNVHLQQAEVNKKNIEAVRGWLKTAEEKMKNIEAMQDRQHDMLTKIAIYHPQHHPGEEIK